MPQAVPGILVVTEAGASGHCSFFRNSVNEGADTRVAIAAPNYRRLELIFPGTPSARLALPLVAAEEPKNEG